jgi:hypothetical protein
VAAEGGADATGIEGVSEAEAEAGLEKKKKKSKKQKQQQGVELSFDW